jgi:hypothetical protein
VKKAVELLEEACKDLEESGRGMIYQMQISGGLDTIREAIALLKAPRWETTEQYEKRTGKAWPDDWAVYTLCENNINGNRWWFCESYHYASIRMCTGSRLVAIICATEAGPPPDEWRPEE